MGHEDKEGSPPRSLEELNELLAKIPVPSTPLWRKLRTAAYTTVGLLLYPVWGLLSSAILFNSGLVHGVLKRAITGILFAGILPVVLHIFEVCIGKEYFEWSTVLVSLSLGGVFAIFLGSILQVVLLYFGIHRVIGLPIDTWYWRFPDWMFNSGY